MRRWELAAACALDLAIGDPFGLPHPVRWIGSASSRLERVLLARVDARAPVPGTIAGVALAAATATVAAASAGAMARSGWPARLVLGAAALAARELDREIAAVDRALSCGDLALARVRVARIVGRDTHDLDASGIARAALETGAESLCDGFIAPLLMLRCGGTALAWCFKAISTLDSTVGHVEAPYTYFGTCAARADDALNYVPARITVIAIALAAAACGEDAASALRIAWRDGPLHRSPNAGWCEAALAGALMVRLGGENTYDGVRTAGAVFGKEFRAPQTSDVARARTLLRVAGAFAALAIVMTAPR